MKSIHVTARAVIISEQHMLLYKSGISCEPLYYLPGGHVDAGETAAQAVIRELHEELGINAKIIRFLGCLEEMQVSSYKQACHTQSYDFFFAVHAPELDARIPPRKLSGHGEVQWVPLAALATMPFSCVLFPAMLVRWQEHDYAPALATAQ